MTELIIGIIILVAAIVCKFKFARMCMADDQKNFDKEKAIVGEYLARNKAQDESPLKRGYIRVHYYTNIPNRPYISTLFYEIPWHAQVHDIPLENILDVYPSADRIRDKNRNTYIELPGYFNQRWGNYCEQGIDVMEDYETVKKMIADAKQRLTNNTNTSCNCNNSNKAKPKENVADKYNVNKHEAEDATFTESQDA